MRRRGSDGHDEESFLEQIRRASRSGGLEFQSRRRLAAAFADYDAELAARSDGEPGMSYKYQCQFCGSRFSLAQQCDAHEAACGMVGQDKEKSMPGKGQRPITCKHCGQVSPSLKEHAAHLLSAHREETLARRRELAASRKAQDEKIGATARTRSAASPGRARPVRGPGALAGPAPSIAAAAAQTFAASGAIAAPASSLSGSGTETLSGSGAVAAPAPALACVAIKNAGSGPSESARRGGNGHHAAGSPATSAGRCCPTCGGPIPERTAQLVAELMTLGISEDQSFAATRAARRILGPAGSG